MVVFYRRKYLIDKRMQLKYALMIGVVLLVMVILVEVHSYLTMQSLLPNLFSSAIGNQVKQIQMSLLINGIIYTVVVALVSIIISHKIAGPVFRLKKDIREMIDTKNYARKLSVRKGDELQDLVTVINELLTNINQK
jgi:signal transduction histidine kinase